jgi:hypothetical protein
MGGEDLPLRRARIIGAMGPGVILLGLIWAVLRLVLTDPTLSLRAIVFAPPHQMIVVGMLISIVCIPVALAVREATPAELALPGIDESVAVPEQEREDGRARRRRSYQEL